jgi:hypothetical protein
MDQEASPAVACSLAPGELEGRLEEFRALFAAGLRNIDRQPRRLSLTLDVDSVSEAAVRDVLRREQECCPFFMFDVQVIDSRIHVAMAVPEGAEQALDDFEHLARSVSLR